MEKTRILIVEDEIIIAQGIATVLAESGYIVSDIVPSGELAVEKSLRDQPDLILMDIVLNGEMSGIEACRKIQKNSHLPVIFLTAFSDRETLKLLKDTEPYGYIIKPFSEMELQATVKSALQKYQIDMKLRASELKYRSLTENLSIGIFRMIPDAGGKFIEVNKAFAKILGYRNKKELFRYRLSDIYFDSRHRQNLFRSLQKSGKIKQEIILRKKNGDEIICISTAVAVKNKNNEIVYVDGLLEDITEKKHLEEKLKEHAGYVHQDPNPVIQIDAKGKIVFANPAAREAFLPTMNKTSKDQFLTHLKLTSTSHFSDKKKTVCEAKAGDRHFSLLTKRLRHNGHTIIYANDITTIKKIQKDLQDSEEKFKAMNAAANDAIIMMDNSGKVTFWNKAAEKIFGYKKKEIIGEDLHLLLAPSYFRALFETGFGRFKKDGQGDVVGKTVELIALNKKGEEFNIELSLSACQIKEKWHAIGIVRDISFRKMIENAMVEAKEMAEAANRSKSEFLANMSHEIRTPMNAIIGMADLALTTQLNPLQEEYLSTIRDSAGSLMRIINDILDFSKIEAGKFNLDEIDFNLYESLRFSINTLIFKANEKGLELLCHVHPDVPGHLIGDPGRLRQILINLVGNALKFTSHGEIVLEIKLIRKNKKKAVLSFSVTDSGIGIPKDKQQLIFQSFTQADGSSTREYGGTGLGLAISAQLVSLMGGELKVDSQLRKGSRFYFDAQFGVQNQSKKINRSLAMEDLVGLQAVVVDDNKINRKIIKELLSIWKFNTEESENAFSALKLIKKMAADSNTPDLLIVDAQMPRMDGFQLAEKIKKEMKLTDMAIIIMSSAGRRGDAARCRQLNISGYLPKPVFKEDLLKAVRIVLGMEKSEKTNNQLITQYTIRENEIKLKVLVVEDNLVNQKLTVKMLEPQGYSVTVASNGKEALKFLTKDNFDLILMDVQMPVMDGLAATAEIRKREKGTNAHIPIIAMTAHAMAGDRERFLAEGMDGYLSKPVNLQEFFRVIEQAISTKSSNRHVHFEKPVTA